LRPSSIRAGGVHEPSGPRHPSSPLRAMPAAAIATPWASPRRYAQLRAVARRAFRVISAPVSFVLTITTKVMAAIRLSTLNLTIVNQDWSKSEKISTIGEFRSGEVAVPAFLPAIPSTQPIARQPVFRFAQFECLPGRHSAKGKWCRGAGVPGCRGAGVPGCRGAGVPGCRGAGVPGCRGVHRSPEVRGI
jgi:hypothetical protein